MTATQNKLSFASPTVEKLPSIACLGFVDEVFEGKVTDSGSYINQTIHLKGTGANKSTRARFLYRPEWLTPEFHPDSLKTQEGGKGLLFVYEKMIAPRRGSKELSMLQGLAGSEKRFDELASRLLSVEQGENIITDVQNVLHEFLVLEGGEDVTIGYTMKQARQETGEVDEKGHKVRELKDEYELGSFWYPTEAKLKQLKAYAAKKPENLIIAFEDEAPF